MTLTVSVIPASSNAGRETTRHLLKEGITVRGFYRNVSKAPDEFQKSPNFTAIQGDVQDASSLSFSGSDAVFYVPPPIYDGTDLGDFATRAANNIKTALAKASVRRLVLLSAPGSQHESGIGILKINHISEVILNQSAPEVYVLRPFYFFEDWASQIPTLKQDPPTMTSIYSPLDYKVPMVSLQDVGLHAARCITGPAPSQSPHIFRLYGPQAYSSYDVRDAIARAIGKDVKINEITPDKLREHTAALVPESIVDDVVGITTATLPGGILESEYEPQEGVDKIGQVRLEDAFVEVFGGLKE